MMYDVPETKEIYRSHISALKLLMLMGYEYLSAPQALIARDQKTNAVLLRGILVAELQKRTFTYKGKSYPLSANAIEKIVRDLESPILNEGLLIANERIYDQLTLGIAVTEFIEGKKYFPTIPIIDWDNIDNNQFHVTDEFEVLNTSGMDHRRPGIVGFVNGLPLIVIESQWPDAPNANKQLLQQAISQQIRHQTSAEIPHLFVYSQLLLVINGIEGRYATTKTPAKFWAKWVEEHYDEAYFLKLKNSKLNLSQQLALFKHREPWVADYFSEQSQTQVFPTDQDKLLICLLAPQRLLELIRYFILFDKRVGKIVARYPQAFGVKNMLQRVTQMNNKGGREGGVIWHTTGSGKSFSMVYLCKALIQSEGLKECRIIVVTDRKDLEKQLSKTFMASGAFGSELATSKEGGRAKVKSGKELAKRIAQGSERIIFTIIDKFSTASKQSECYNPSSNIIVLVDEGHRSHCGETHQRMRQVLPNAAYIAFTGTPLLKNDKTTNKFGPIIHAYTMQRAIEDGMVTPLLYEERIPMLSFEQDPTGSGVNKKVIDNWFERMTAGQGEQKKVDLKKKFIKKGAIYRSANRIELIAWDISLHFSENIKPLASGLKGQLATDSKISAIRYKHYLDELAQVRTAVVMSAPDSREEMDASHLPELQQWWKKNIGSQNEEDYTRDVMAAFASDQGPEILIVVDKLLTGFDEPRNTVLYIDKALKQHNLIQAVARVNRLHAEKQYGFLIDYRGILKELDTTIKKYRDLAQNTQSGFEINDIKGLYHPVNTKYKRLPKLHQSLLAIFDAVKNKKDLEHYRQILMPKYMDDGHGQIYDTRQKLREDFYQALTEFALCLKIALSSINFFQEPGVTETDIRSYKDDLYFFFSLRKMTKIDAQEVISYSSYEKKISQLVDKQVIGEAIKDPKGVYLVGDLGMEDPEKWSQEKIRNETDMIRACLKYGIEQNLVVDPYAQQVFSGLLKQAIAAAEAMFEHPYQKYRLYKDLHEQLKRRELNNTPECFADNQSAKIYYGLFRLILGDAELNRAAIDSKAQQEQQIYVEYAKWIDQVVTKAVAEYSLTPQNIESEIRRQLLPRLYKLLGMSKAKKLIEHVIRITRIGFSANDSGV